MGGGRQGGLPPHAPRASRPTRPRATSRVGKTQQAPGREPGGVARADGEGGTLTANGRKLFLKRDDHILVCIFWISAYNFGFLI